MKRRTTFQIPYYVVILNGFDNVALLYQMTLFAQQKALLNNVINTEFPPKVVKAINDGDYEMAAETLVVQNYPFQETMKMISNCPRMMCAYLYRRACAIGSNLGAQQIVCQLYLQSAIFGLCLLSDAERKSETEKIKRFIHDYKKYLSQKLVMQLIKKSGELSLMVDTCIAFNDINTLVDYCLSVNDFQTLKNYILLIKDIDVQRQVLLRFQKRNTIQLVETLDNEASSITIDAIFDTLVELTFKASTLNNVMVENISEIFEQFYENGVLTKSAHAMAYFILLSILGNEEKIYKLFNEPIFKILDKDFYVSFLIRRNMYSLAANVYARCHNRHSLAITYGLKCSFATTLALLKGPISGARDEKSCWLQALRICSDPEKAPEDTDFCALITAADKSKTVTLDDMFPLIPRDMELNSLHLIIANAVQDSSNQIKNNEELRTKIEKRAEEQRNLVSSQNLKPISIEPSDAICYLCGRSACDSQFEAFPCGHLVHTSCYLLSMGSSGDSSEEINKLTESCPACGTASLVILDKPFISTNEDEEEKEKWAILD